MPVPHHSVFTGWMPFLLPNQQHQCTEWLIHVQRYSSTFTDTDICTQSYNTAEMTQPSKNLPHKSRMIVFCRTNQGHEHGKSEPLTFHQDHPRIGRKVMRKYEKLPAPNTLFGLVVRLDYNTSARQILKPAACRCQVQAEPSGGDLLDEHTTPGDSNQHGIIDRHQTDPVSSQRSWVHYGLLVPMHYGDNDDIK